MDLLIHHHLQVLKHKKNDVFIKVLKELDNYLSFDGITSKDIITKSNCITITEVSFEEKQLDVTLLTSEKLSVLDLHVITETTMNINVAIQLVNRII